MALKKEIMYRGFSLEYWKILQTEIDYQTGGINISIGLYKDQNSRIEDISNTLKVYNYIYGGDQTEPTRAQLYVWLKANIDEFSNAIDI